MAPRVNYLAALLCVILHALLGMAWFGYWAEPWTHMLGRSMDEMHSAGSAMPYIWSFIESIVFALLIAWLVRKLGTHTFSSGARLGLVVGVATIGIAGITNYQFAMRPMQMALIDFGFPILSLTMMGAVQGAWKSKFAKFAKIASF